MFDHVTLRVPDPAVAGSAFKAVLDQPEIDQTRSTELHGVRTPRADGRHDFG
jgi:hypothetical protein